jgi:hypothetical protein
MISRHSVIALLSAALLLLRVGPVAADEPPATESFSFSAEAAKDQDRRDAEAAARAQSIQALVSAPCRQQLKNQRILLLIGEQTSGRWLAGQDRYGQFFRIIDNRLKSLGLKTITQEEIKANIAQAEVDAYFNNDPDAALAASKKLGARYVLRGAIGSRASVNPVVQVKEVSVNIDLTLSATDGRVLSDVNAHAESYSGSDVLGAALQLVKEQADPLVAQLYNDYCRESAGTKQ